MTTIATIVGPRARWRSASARGARPNLPLARAVIGGLTVSTFFTLFLVPALYTGAGAVLASQRGDGSAG